MNTHQIVIVAVSAVAAIVGISFFVSVDTRSEPATQGSANAERIHYNQGFYLYRVRDEPRGVDCYVYPGNALSCVRYK